MTGRMPTPPPPLVLDAERIVAADDLRIVPVVGGPAEGQEDTDSKAPPIILDRRAE